MPASFPSDSIAGHGNRKSDRSGQRLLLAALLTLPFAVPSPPASADSGAASDRFASAAAPTAGATADDWRIEINLPERRLRVYSRVVSDNIGDIWRLWGDFPVAVGARRHPTPIVETRLAPGIVRPDWAAPNQAWAGEHRGQLVPFMAPGNPFRTRNAQGRWEGYFLPLGLTGIGLHSTNQRSSIGKSASHGCIRMNLDDVRKLHREIPAGSRIATVYRLFACAQEGDSIVIKSFPDIYGRLSTIDRLDQLQAALLDVNLSAELLDPKVLDRLISEPGHTVSLVKTGLYDVEDPDHPQAVTPPLPALGNSLLSALNKLHQESTHR